MIRFLLSQATALAGTLALAAWTHCEGLWTIGLSIGFALALLVCLVILRSEQFKGKRVFFVASRKEGGEAGWKCSSSEVEFRHLPAACR